MPRTIVFEAKINVSLDAKDVARELAKLVQQGAIGPPIHCRHTLDMFAPDNVVEDEVGATHPAVEVERCEEEGLPEGVPRR